MASTKSLVLAQTLPSHQPPQKAQAKKHAAVTLPTRRHCLLLLTATTALKAMEMPARSQDIPLFGLRRGLQKAELIVEEGFEAAEKEIEAAETEVETVLSYGGLAQAGVVAGAEVLGVVIATSIVNGILGPEAKKS